VTCPHVLKYKPLFHDTHVCVHNFVCACVCTCTWVRMQVLCSGDLQFNAGLYLTACENVRPDVSFLSLQLMSYRYVSCMS